MSKKKETLKEMSEWITKKLKEGVGLFKPRSPIKPSRRHKDKTKYTRKRKHKKGWD